MPRRALGSWCRKLWYLWQRTLEMDIRTRDSLKLEFLAINYIGTTQKIACRHRISRAKQLQNIRMCAHTNIKYCCSKTQGFKPKDHTADFTEKIIHPFDQTKQKHAYTHIIKHKSNAEHIFPTQSRFTSLNTHYLPALVLIKTI